MKRLIIFSALSLVLSVLGSCGSEPVAAEPKEQSLVEFKDGVYTEYYPGRKAIKFKGRKDENNQRHGIWYFYAENGLEQSMTEYKHGKKDGASFARFPNGKMRYFGEYKEDQPHGEWTIYNEDGTTSVKNYGGEEETAKK
jgi:antitoxin component YwqK of YwqJK toxin-antitoxin module